MLPQNTQNWEATRDFLKQVVEILLDYIKEENDRNSKILDFHHPEEMLGIMNFTIPEKPMNLKELLEVCHFS